MAVTRVSMKDVARAAGVSAAAVSRVLNNNGYVGEEKRARVEAVIRRLGYRPNAVARSLVKSKSRTIGLCLPYLDTPFIAGLMEGVEAESEKHGYDVFMCHTREDPEAEKNAMIRMLDRQVEGIIAVPVLGGRHCFKDIVNLVPTMLLLRKPRGVDRNLIRISDYKSARRSFSILLENGHRDIAVIGGPPGVSTIRERWRAIRDLLREYRLELDPVRIVHTPFKYRESYEATRGLLAGGSRPTALYIMHYWGSGVLRHIYDLGLKIPDDISVAAYESFVDWDFMFPLRLATNIFAADKVGVAAVSRLHGLIAEKRLFMDENVEIEQTFHPNDSVRNITGRACG